MVIAFIPLLHFGHVTSVRYVTNAFQYIFSIGPKSSRAPSAFAAMSARAGCLNFAAHMWCACRPAWLLRRPFFSFLAAGDDSRCCPPVSHLFP